MQLKQDQAQAQALQTAQEEEAERTRRQNADEAERAKREAESAARDVEERRLRADEAHAKAQADAAAAVKAKRDSEAKTAADAKAKADALAAAEVAAKAKEKAEAEAEAKAKIEALESKRRRDEEARKKAAEAATGTKKPRKWLRYVIGATALVVCYLIISNQSRPDDAAACQVALTAADRFRNANDFPNARVQVGIATALCTDDHREQAKVLEATIVQAQEAYLACDKAMAAGDSLVAEGKLDQARTVLTMKETACRTSEPVKMRVQEIENRRKEAAAKLTTALSQAGNGEYDAARATLTEAAKLDAGSSRVAMALRQIEMNEVAKLAAQSRDQMKAGDLGGAEQSIQAALQIDPNSNVAKQAAREFELRKQTAAVPERPEQQAAAPMSLPTPIPAAAPAPAAQPPVAANLQRRIDTVLMAAGSSMWPAVDSQMSALLSAAQLTALQAAQTAARTGRGANRDMSTSVTKYADSLYLAGKDREAIDAYRRAIDADASDAEPWLGLGIALLETRRLDEAIDAYGKSVLLDPATGRRWAYLAEPLALQGKTIEAINTLRVAAHYEPRRAMFADWARGRAKAQPNPAFQTAVRSVLADLDRIPLAAGAGTNAPTGSAPSPSPAPAPAPLPTPADNTARQTECQIFVRTGRTALGNKSYGDAISHAREALNALPGCPGAEQLIREAQAQWDAARSAPSIR